MKRQDCWNDVGVWGDKNCPQLTQTVHCRNCPIYSAAATDLLDHPIDAEYLSEWADHFRVKKQPVSRATDCVVIFRIGAEWLALPPGVVHEVCAPRLIHSLPYRRNAAVLGIVNVRGALLACVSLHELLGVTAKPKESVVQRQIIYERHLVASREGPPLVFPVDEIHGLHRFHPGELGALPTTNAKSATTYTRAMLSWKEEAVGLLDDQLLFYSLEKSLA